MPFDWFFEVERIIIRLVPAYTLELLDECDVYRLLPYYFFDYRTSLREKERLLNGTNDDESETDIVVRDGKKYHVTTADKASWADKIF